jgi:hypothetical protein
MKAKTMKEKYEKIMEKKISTPIDTLCKGFPGIIYYLHKMKFKLLFTILEI